MTRLLPILALVALGVACTTAMTRPQLEAELASAGAATTGGDAALQLFPIHAQSAIEARIQLAEEQNTPESATLSRSLSRKLVVNAQRGKTLVVGGPHAELSDRVVVNALAQRKERPLAGLTLVFVSPTAPSPELREAARAARIALRHHAMLAP